jgi:hypothetical protein
MIGMAARSVRDLRGVPLLLLLILTAPSRGDTFTYVDKAGAVHVKEAMLYGSGLGLHALLGADGQITVVPQAAVTTRVPGDDPVPVTPAEMVQLLETEFQEPGIRTHVEGYYVVALVLAGPLPERSEVRVGGFLRKAATFMKTVDSVFSRYCRDMRIQFEPPQFPLVTLIFETDRDFDAYANDVSGGEGLAAENILGFYSPLTNRLSLRMAECRSFQVPLHEAIHQQVFNRGLLQRLAGVPVWFNEGIATGFENDGERINVGPERINATYARRVAGTGELTWEEIVNQDAAFTGDVLAGEAYTHAWCLHWTLVTQHRRAYVQYLQRLGQIEPFQQPLADERARQFQETFGVSVTELQQDFPRLLSAGLKRQKIRLDSPGNANGRSVTFGDSSEIEVTAVQRGDAGTIEVEGRLRNMSPFRDLAYYVSVHTEGGMYADWILPAVSSLKTYPLARQPVLKRGPGASGPPGDRYWVEVTAAMPESPEVSEWRQGKVPDRHLRGR